MADLPNAESKERTTSSSKDSNPRGPKFSVVMVTFQRPDALRTSLEGLASLKNAPLYELILIDNDAQGSGRSTIAPFLAQRPSWRYQICPRNNVSLARNLGAGLAGGEWLAFLDDDCVPYPSWLAEAESFLATHPGAGLIFGGPYLTSDDCPESKKTTQLPRERYLLEGNLFFKRKEYLELQGMRTDLGPQGNRFGYHEGSELQDRHLEKFGSQHQRILEPRLAVLHLRANRSSRFLLSYLSGLDAVRAFPSKKSTQLHDIPVLYLKLLPSLIRAVFFVLQGSSGEGKAHRELYRLGEIYGEIQVYWNRAGNWLSQILRHQNNRLTRRKSRPGLRPRATAEDYFRLLSRGQPFGAGKIGTAEILALEYHDRFFRPSWLVQGWRRPAERLANNAGFFPVEETFLQKWDQEMRQAVASLDFVCAWQTDPFLQKYEQALLTEIAPASRSVPMDWLGKSVLPQIAGFRWLVISPFVKTMRQQLPRLQQVHDPSNQWGLDWRKLEQQCVFLRCPLQWHLESSPYRTWQEGLESLAEQALAMNFDLALVGAGAWSLPLVARIKQDGRAAIHTGGETQLFFGIKGKRWHHQDFYNSYWTSALPEETPAEQHRIDDGCYW